MDYRTCPAKNIPPISSSALAGAWRRPVRVARRSSAKNIRYIGYGLADYSTTIELSLRDRRKPSIVAAWRVEETGRPVKMPPLARPGPFRA